MIKPAPVPFGYIPVGSPLMEHQQENPAVEYTPALKRIGGRLWDADMIPEPLPLFYFVATGGTERKILELRENRDRVSPGEPLLLLAHSGNNSLPAALEVLARLQQEGGRGRILYLRGPDDEDGLRQIAAAAGDMEAFLHMRRTRIGLLGEPSDWLVASSPDPDTVTTIWGPAIVSIDLEMLERSIESVPDESLQAPIEALISAANAVHEPGREDLSGAMRLALAMKVLVDKYRLNAISLRCFDLISKRRTTGCLALARLQDTGVVAGCEGDLVSALTMLWLQTLLGETAWMANTAGIDVHQNVLRLAHCTVPLHLVADFSLRSHFESGLGVSIQGRMKNGPVTLARIGGQRLDRIFLAEGSIRGTRQDDRLCRTQVDVQLTDRESISVLLNKPLGNHLALATGHHAGRLRNWWELMIKKEDP